MLTEIIKILIDVEGLGIEEFLEAVYYLADIHKENNKLKLDIEGLKSNNKRLQQQLDEENR